MPRPFPSEGVERFTRRSLFLPKYRGGLRQLLGGDQEKCVAASPRSLLLIAFQTFGDIVATGFSQAN